MNTKTTKTTKSQTQQPDNRIVTEITLAPPPCNKCMSIFDLRQTKPGDIVTFWESSAIFASQTNGTWETREFQCMFNNEEYILFMGLPSPTSNLTLPYVKRGYALIGIKEDKSGKIKCSSTPYGHVWESKPSLVYFEKSGETKDTNRKFMDFPKNICSYNDMRNLSLGEKVRIHSYFNLTTHSYPAYVTQIIDIKHPTQPIIFQSQDYSLLNRDLIAIDNPSGRDWEICKNLPNVILKEQLPTRAGIPFFFVIEKLPEQ